MPGRYLCDGGTENCGGRRCLEILAAQEKSSKEANHKKQETLGSSPIQNASDTKPNSSDSSNSTLDIIKNKTNEIIDNSIGTTQEVCLIKQGDFENSVLLTKGATLGKCIEAISEGLSNPLDNIMCVSGIGVSATTDIMSHSWKNHCYQLPKESDINKSLKENP